VARFGSVAGERISGAVAAAATPLCDDGRRLDEEAFGPLLDFYGGSGVAGVLVLGTTGEGILLDPDERRRAAELAIAAAGGLRVIVHCGAQTSAETSELAAHAARAGADAVAVIAPPYFAFDDDELLEHFAMAAAACAPLAFYVYEYAERSGYSVPPAVVDRLRQRAPNIAGLKVSDTPFERVEPYLATGLDVFVGAEPLIVPGVAAGATGAVSAVGGAFPDEVAALVRDPGPEREARLGALRAALSVRRLQASVKEALRWRGVPVRPDVRRPLLPLSEDEAGALRAELERVLDVRQVA
jgi:dihydrodipicolinate synthase/N-acetylneuraminate lyase